MHEFQDWDEVAQFCEITWPSPWEFRIGWASRRSRLHNLFVIKDINFFFFLDDSYASTPYSEHITVYIQGVPIS
jgi:hypothetical protein